MESPPFRSARSSEGARLFTLGFLTLFLELALIRYLAAAIWNLGYFPNFVLIAVFIGMGLGFTVHHWVPLRWSPRLYQGAMLALVVLFVGVHLWHPTVPGFSSWKGALGDDLYFTSIPQRAASQSLLPFAVCLAGLVAVFALISQRTAKVFREFRPLTAYTLDILGSCAGILSFMLVSWLGIPAWAWFAAFTALFVLSLTGSWGPRLLPMALGLALVLLALRQDARLVANPKWAGTLETHWSPYQKVEYTGNPGNDIYVNGVQHQSIMREERLPSSFYQTIYDKRMRTNAESPYRQVLVIGAGSGNDVQAALLNGAEHIDAVEIDPVIAELGRRHHPGQPYSSPRVELVIDDGRAFMTRTRRRYDLVVFALTDSLVKVSSLSQLRLENYLFTGEAVQRAFRLLRPGGDLIFYNYYRLPWLRQKIEEMARRATGTEPEIIHQRGDFAVIRVRQGDPPATEAAAAIDLPSDDWPFLYLVRRGVPRIYGWAMAGMFSLVLLLVVGLHLATRRREGYGGPEKLALKAAFVLMGLAFLLLETKSVIQFSLLFGTTWLNNSLVFLAVLLLVLAANWTARGIRDRRWLSGVYLLLVASAVFGMALPLGALLGIESAGWRFVVASLVTFSPIFFANLVFSVVFRDQEVPEHMFGWNLIGATLGGVVEYSSMRFGYRFLGLAVVLCYTLVIVLIHFARAGSGRTARPSPAR